MITSVLMPTASKKAHLSSAIKLKDQVMVHSRESFKISFEHL